MVCDVHELHGGEGGAVEHHAVEIDAVGGRPLYRVKLRVKHHPVLVDVVGAQLDDLVVLSEVLRVREVLRACLWCVCLCMYVCVCA